MVVARWLPFLTLEIAFQFQMYLLGHYHALDKHTETVSGNIF